MKKLEQLLFLLNKVKRVFLSKKYNQTNPSAYTKNIDSSTWKVDWIDQNGEKGTYDTQEADLQEAEWKFNYMFDDRLKIIKMHRDSVIKKGLK